MTKLLFCLTIQRSPKPAVGDVQALQKVDDALLLQSNALLTNITGAFAALTTVRGALAIDGNAVLAAVTGASFGSLTGVGQSLDISGNTNLGSITNAFQVTYTLLTGWIAWQNLT